MAAPEPPESRAYRSRAYRHTACGEETLVEGRSFGIVSNPMSDMERTRCANCGAMFPIAEFEWVDTGESLSDDYARHTGSATDRQRFLCSKTVMLAPVGLGAAPAAAGAFYLVRDDDRLTKAVCLFGGAAIGAMTGAALFLKGLTGPITRKVCGVSDTRLLT